MTTSVVLGNFYQSYSDAAKTNAGMLARELLGGFRKYHTVKQISRKVCIMRYWQGINSIDVEVNEETGKVISFQAVMSPVSKKFIVEH